MNIDSTALKSLAQRIIDRRNDAVREDRLTKQNALRTYAAAIEVQLDAIAAVADAIYMLKTAKIKGVDSFFTEGFHHRVGFSDRRRNLVGCCGGGCSGKSLFVNFKTKHYVVCEWYGEGGSDERTLDELVAKFWNDGNVRFKMKELAEELADFAEQAAKMITTIAFA